VPDLKREDFTVKIGGKPMPIDYFARVADGTIHAPDLATASPDQVLAVYTKGTEAVVPRNFLIYIDLGFISPGIRNRSLNALSDFVTRLGPADATRIVLFDRSPRVLQDWTTSKESAMSVLAKIERENPGMSRLQTERQTIALIDSTAPQAGAQQYAQEIARDRDHAQSRASRHAAPPARSPSSSPGPEYQPGCRCPSTRRVGRRPRGVQHPPDLQRVGSVNQNSNADEITFYTIDATVDG
jgi:hypothetical protein